MPTDKIVELTEDEYKEFFSWIFDKEVNLEKEVDITKILEYKNPYIYYTPEIKAFFETQAMQRLGKIGQLANVALHNPNATHSRLEHCKGAYQKILEFYIQQYKKNDWKNKNFDKDRKLLILADLMDMASHDIGHNVLSHALEGLLGDFRGAHEVIGDRILHENQEIVNALKNIHPDLLKNLDIVKSNKYNLHTLKEGNIDFDRIDFLTRDSIYLGVEDGYESNENKETITEIIRNITSGCNIIPINYKGKNINVPVYDEDVISDIETFLERRFENYQNIYVSNENRANDIILENFCKILVQKDEDSYPELKKYLLNLKNNDIQNINLEEYINWNDIRFYSEIMKLIKNTKNDELKKFALDCLPTYEALLSMDKYKIEPMISDKIISEENNVEDYLQGYEKDFYLNVKEIFEGKSDFAKLVKDENAKDKMMFFYFDNKLDLQDALDKLKNGFYDENNCFTRISENAISKLIKYKRKIKMYEKDEPIFIKGKNNKIYTYDEYPNKKLDLVGEKSRGFIAIPSLLAIQGVDSKDIENIKKFYNIFYKDKKTDTVNFDKSSRLFSDLYDLKMKFEEEEK